jgi:hypothetical protein
MIKKECPTHAEGTRSGFARSSSFREASDDETGFASPFQSNMADDISQSAETPPIVAVHYPFLHMIVLLLTSLRMFLLLYRVHP